MRWPGKVTRLSRKQSIANNCYLVKEYRFSVPAVVTMDTLTDLSGSQRQDAK